MAAGIVLLVTASLTAGVYLARSGSAEDRLTEAVVAGHIRSLQVAHATDVANSNQHIVKPWFSGKVDFAPQVPDLSAAGFPLSGGRLDYLVDRPVVAIIYHRREHLINVFTWPATDGESDRGLRTFHKQGFNIRRWQRAGMAYWVISDLNPQELDTFVMAFQPHCAVPSP
jgi:anti-sigma factor RsiW